MFVSLVQWGQRVLNGLGLADASTDPRARHKAQLSFEGLESRCMLSSDFAPLAIEITMGHGIPYAEVWSPTGESADGSGYGSAQGSSSGASSEVDLSGFVLTPNDAEGSGVGFASAAESTSGNFISIGDAVVNESAGTAQFAVNLLGAPPPMSVSVSFTTADGTAASGSDYTSQNGTITWGAGDTSTKYVTVSIANDNVPEPDEHFYVNLSNPTGVAVVIQDSQGQGTIENDDVDTPPTISIADVTQSEGNSGLTTFNFEVTLSKPSTSTVTVAYSTADGTGTTSDGDYAAVSNQVITFNPGETSKSAAVSVIGDTRSENDETFGVTLSSATDASIADGSATGTIENDDAVPTLSVADVEMTEGDSGNTALEFTVTLSSASGKQVTVNYTIGDGTAETGDSDYSAVSSGQLTFAPGVTSANVSASVIGDLKFEDDETFTITLTTPVNATLLAAVGTATIRNNDPRPTISIEDKSVTEGAAGANAPVQLKVTLSNASSKTVKVNYKTAGGSATVADNDFGEVTERTLEFAPGQTEKTVTVNVTGDAKNEADEKFTILLSAPIEATIADGAGEVTIVNDDPRPTMSVASVSQTEGNQGEKDFTFLVELSAPSGQVVEVDYATADGTATLNDRDYVAASGHLVFQPGEMSKQVTVKVNGDTKVETDQTFALNLSNHKNATPASAGGSGQPGPNGTGTIKNDDTTILSINDVNVSEAAGTATFTLTLSAPTDQSVSVNYATADGNAVAGSDYQSLSGIATFEAGQVSRTLTVSLINDADPEPQENFAVILSNSQGAPLEANPFGVATIRDDDAAPSTDIKVIGVTSVLNPVTNDYVLRLEYTVEGADLPKITFGYYAELADGGDYILLGTDDTTGDQAKMGRHVVLLNPNLVDIQQDYRLFVKADPFDHVRETKENNNQELFKSGVFRAADRRVHVQGVVGVDIVTARVDGFVFQVGFNGEDYNFSVAAVETLSIRTREGRDDVTLQIGPDPVAIETWLFGGVGNDRLVGGGGNDLIRGGSGDDTIEGAGGDDQLDGGKGNDTYVFEDVDGRQLGHDTIIEPVLSNGVEDNSEDALDLTLMGTTITLDISSNTPQTISSTLVLTMNGSAIENVLGSLRMHNRITGNDRDNKLYGGWDFDILEGKGGDDLLEGKEGGDLLAGGKGNDKLDGGLGDDKYEFTLNGDLGTDTLVFQPNGSAGGNDSLDFRGLASGITIDLDKGGAQEVASGAAKLTLKGVRGARIENVFGTNFDDIIIGNEFDNLLQGQDGNDILIGGSGQDTLIGFAGLDFLLGGAGADFLTGDTGNDVFVVDTTNFDRPNNRELAAIMLAHAQWVAQTPASGPLVTNLFRGTNDGAGDTITDSAIGDLVVDSPPAG